ncbi:hypothetical protein HaLaN_13348 [Haematococcus lacustris]|uniref:Uncharacterized protein n=1 Tax=Haematococcus lacustris TaxID=44745 RepID=A0A699ZM31_HAELA|nr:hypothetical protein HaLaN_13348 [Haematococcus lacustris]
MQHHHRHHRPITPTQATAGWLSWTVFYGAMATAPWPRRYGDTALRRCNAAALRHYNATALGRPPLHHYHVTSVEPVGDADTQRVVVQPCTPYGSGWNNAGRAKHCALVGWLWKHGGKRWLCKLCNGYHFRSAPVAGPPVRWRPDAPPSMATPLRWCCSVPVMSPKKNRKRPVSPAPSAAGGGGHEMGVTPTLPPGEGSGSVPGSGLLQPGWVEGGGGAGGVSQGGGAA